MNQENGTKHISFKPISVNCHERTRSGADTFTFIFFGKNLYREAVSALVTTPLNQQWNL